MGGSGGLDADLRAAVSLAITVADKIAAIDAGRRSPLVVFGRGQLDRRVMLRGTYTRRLLAGLDADRDRLLAVAETCRAEQRRLQAATHLDPDPTATGRRGGIYELAAQLADDAAALVAAAGLPSEAGPHARTAVAEESALWLAHLEPGWRRHLWWARWRRRTILARDALTRRLPGP